MNIKDKKVVITVGSGGIDSSITEMLLLNGAVVGCVDKNNKSLEKLTTKYKSYSKNLRTFSIDVTDTLMPRNSMNNNQIKNWISKIPMQRMGEPSEITHSVEYIISNDFFCGRTIQIDGSLSM